MCKLYTAVHASIALSKSLQAACRYSACPNQKTLLAVTRLKSLISVLIFVSSMVFSIFDKGEMAYSQEWHHDDSTMRHAASADSKAERDSRALPIVQASLSALGALSAQNLEVTGEVLNLDGSVRGTFTWKDVGKIHEAELSTASHHRYFRVGSNPKNEQDGKSITLQPHQLAASVPRHLPGQLLLDELANLNWSFEFIANEECNGHSCGHVRVLDCATALTQAVSVQDWWFDNVSALPVKLKTRIPRNDNALIYDDDVTVYLTWQDSVIGRIPKQLRNCEQVECGSLFDLQRVVAVPGGNR